MKFIILALAAVSLIAQQTTQSTTLSTAITPSSTAQWCVASATGIVLPNMQQGKNGSLLLVDQEVGQVTGQGSSSTCFRVTRGQMGTSASVSHSVASTVWVGQPGTSSGDPSRPFTGAFVTTVPTGSCVATAQFTLPVLFVGLVQNGAWPGSAYNCINGQWSQIGNGHITGFTGETAISLVDAFAGIPAFIGRRANGTPQAPTAVLGTDVLAVFGGRGYMSTGYSSLTRSDMSSIASETWTDSANGARLVFATTPNTTVTRTNRWSIEDTGDLLPFAASTYNIGSAALPVLKMSLSNCTSGASPAVCGAASTGAVAVAAAATTLVVATTAVTAKSRIVLTMDASLGTDLGVTCNTNNIAMWVSARTAATSFTITTASGPVTNPMCLSFHILN